MSRLIVKPPGVARGCEVGQTFPMAFRKAWRSCLAAALATTVGGALAGCSGAIETYRSAAGINKNDPDPETAPYARNLAAASTADYPNLATVPPPPTGASTAAEHDKLTKTLIAERTSVQESITGLPLGPSGAVVPAPNSPPTQVSRTPPTAAALPMPPPVVAAGAGHSAAPGPPATATAAKPAEEPRTAQRRSAPPSEPAPLETTMELPAVRSLPQPEVTKPAPPPPRLAAIPPVSVAPAPPDTIASAVPSPAPPVPVLPPPPPPAVARAEPKQPVVAATVAELDIPAGSAQLPLADRARLDEVATVYRQRAGTIRVVAYTVPGSDSVQQLANYRAALDRAQLVASALASAGVPANKIQTEASPARAATAPGHVDVQLSP